MSSCVYFIGNYMTVTVYLALHGEEPGYTTIDTGLYYITVFGIIL